MIIEITIAKIILTKKLISVFATFMSIIAYLKVFYDIIYI